MCDILIATPKATKENIMIFAKNSDRDPNEAQILDFIPRQKHMKKKIKLTYVEFPQVEETYAIILSRPWWMYGAEMGANEYGLVIGNTAVFTKERKEKIGILGMDIIRLALERTKNSKEALEFIISMIENYGQGGSGSYEHKLYYHNSFIIADPRNAWVLETVGKNWVAKEIEDIYTISNALTIQNNWDLASKNIEKIKKEDKKFNFSRYFSDKFYTYFSHGKNRRTFTYKKLREKKGEITLEYIMEILCSHQIKDFSPEKGSMKDMCMHYGGLTRPSQTASSQISLLNEKFQVHYFTGTSLPCLSIFKPIYFEGGFLDIGEKPTNKYNPKNYWWRFEAFHRKIQTNYRIYIDNFLKDKNELQEKIIEKEIKIREKYLRGEIDEKELFNLTKWAFDEEEKLLEKWNNIIKIGKFPLLYARNWNKINKEAMLIF
ncbi:MAG: C69 family dipeptidase [Nitrososphaerota archaeon]